MSLKTAHTILLGLAIMFCVVTGVWALGLAKALGARFLVVGIGCVVTLVGAVAQARLFLGRTKDTRWL
ncbi:MAG: hypothetical protein KJ060_04320 [Candidatus Hydrogenedentes bacterium]|nr:hypothetical protein [Candidatus Hydrogenedentota bacterium]